MSLIFHVIEFFSITKQSALSGSLLTLNSFSHSRLECRRNLSFFFFCFFFFQKAISHPAFPLFLQKQIMYFIVIPACCYTSSCSPNSAATVPAALIYKQCAAKKQQKHSENRALGSCLSESTVHTGKLSQEIWVIMNMVPSRVPI